MVFDDRKEETIETLKTLPFIDDHWQREPECSYDGPGDYCPQHDIYDPIKQKVGERLTDWQIQMIINSLRDNEVPISFRLKSKRNRSPSGFYMVFTFDGGETEDERLLYHAVKSGELPRLDLY